MSLLTNLLNQDNDNDDITSWMYDRKEAKQEAKRIESAEREAGINKPAIPGIKFHGLYAIIPGGNK